MPDIKEVSIQGEKYYAKFGMRELMQTAKFAKPATSEQSGKATSEQEDEATPEELENAIALDYDVTLAIFHSALQSGSKRKKVPFKMDVTELEDALDEDPDAFFTLQNAFTESRAVRAMSKKKS